MKKSLILMLLIYAFLPLCTCVAQEGIEDDASSEQIVTVLSERRSDRGVLERKHDIRPLSLREQILYKLKEAHLKGEFLDLKEEDVLALTSYEIEKIFAVQEVVQDLHNNGVEHETYYSDLEKEQDFFENVMAKARENKLLSAMLATMLLGAYPAIRRGMDIVNRETDEDAEDRRRRIANEMELKFQEPEETEDDERIFCSTHRKTRWEFDDLSENVSTNDILATLYERRTFVSPTRQSEQLIQEFFARGKEYDKDLRVAANLAEQTCNSIKARDNVSSSGKAILDGKELEKLCEVGDIKYLTPIIDFDLSSEDIKAASERIVGEDIENIERDMQRVITKRDEADLP